MARQEWVEWTGQQPSAEELRVYYDSNPLGFNQAAAEGRGEGVPAGSERWCARACTCSPTKPQGKERSRQRAARMLECHLAVLRMPTQPPAHPLTA